jgi:hypothetical protein
MKRKLKVPDPVWMLSNTKLLFYILEYNIDSSNTQPVAYSLSWPRYPDPSDDNRSYETVAKIK